MQVNVCFHWGLRTIQVKDSDLQGAIGQRLGLSTEDLQQLKQLYKCNSVGVTGKKQCTVIFLRKLLTKNH